MKYTTENAVCQHMIYLSLDIFFFSFLEQFILILCARNLVTISSA